MNFHVEGSLLIDEVVDLLKDKVDDRVTCKGKHSCNSQPETKKQKIFKGHLVSPIVSVPA